MNNRYLDLILSNHQISVERSLCPLVKENSNLPSLEGEIDLDNSKNALDLKTFNASYNLKKGDFVKLSDLLKDTSWEQLYQSEDVEDVLQKFYEVFDGVSRQCIPLGVKSKKTYPPWFSRNKIGDIKSKDYRSTKMKTTNECSYTSDQN
ncbi:hypothetical protein JTB14_003040 [Gonioctena quinquepunctata]|nr:hypothetical protein JTB14_003040 [Gonioctena quinquepunctata]